MIAKRFIFVIATCAISIACSSTELEKTSIERKNIELAKEKPEIIEVFACSDYCPAPAEQYNVKVYKGIVDAAECLKIGGTPREFFGWGKFFICVANE